MYQSAFDPEVQHTLRRPVSCVGVGLHSGQPVSMTILPGGPHSGINFLRSDAPYAQGLIPARWDTVVDTQLCTVIGNAHGRKVATIEHLMSALSACQIDNALIEIDGPEVPIMDGSAAPFVAMIRQAGLLAQRATRSTLIIDSPIEVRDGAKYAILLPNPRPRISISIEFPNTAIQDQQLSLVISDKRFDVDIARARTFGFADQLAQLRQRGLALGGSLHNAVLVDGDTVVNPEGLRFADEFVRHKVLDCIGDLALAGMPIIGHLQAYKPGHALNNQLLHALFAQPQAWHLQPTKVGPARIATFGSATESVPAWANRAVI